MRFRLLLPPLLLLALAAAPARGASAAQLRAFFGAYREECVAPARNAAWRAALARHAARSSRALAALRRGDFADDARATDPEALATRGAALPEDEEEGFDADFVAGPRAGAGSGEGDDEDEGDDEGDDEDEDDGLLGEAAVSSTGVARRARGSARARPRPRPRSLPLSARPALTVWRAPPRGSPIGAGCLLPGAANAFLSAAFRGRAFLLDWPATAAALGGAPGAAERRANLSAEARAADWALLAGAAALGPGATEVHWEQREGVRWWGSAAALELEEEAAGGAGGGAARAGSPAAPRLWGRPRHADVETWDVMNRGAFTQTHAERMDPAERAWLDRVLPRDAAGGLMMGCVYAAAGAFPSDALLARAAALVPALPPPRDAGPLRRGASSSGGGDAPTLICLHVRTWDLEPGAVPLGAASPAAQAGFRCLEKVLREVGGAGAAVFVASDSEAVRAAARERFGGARAVLSSAAAPAHTAFLPEALGNAQAEAVFEGALAEWAVLAQCPVIVASIWSGFSRSAAAASWRSALYFADDEEDGLPACRRWEGAARSRTLTVGAGW